MWLTRQNGEFQLRSLWHPPFTTKDIDEVFEKIRQYEDRDAQNDSMAEGASVHGEAVEQSVVSEEQELERSGV